VERAAAGGTSKIRPRTGSSTTNGFGGALKSVGVCVQATLRFGTAAIRIAPFHALLRQGPTPELAPMTSAVLPSMDVMLPPVTRTIEPGAKDAGAALFCREVGRSDRIDTFVSSLPLNAGPRSTRRP
jgi:hypothetical protein